MKVNTDGVLLGSWADVSEAKHILDIGTGTGVIALMMAQRKSEAAIDAIDIDIDAYSQTKKNFEQSPWSEKVNAIHSSLQKFNTDKKYDVIISNPPYFVDGYKSDNDQKNIAKHSTALTYQELLKGISRLLSENGKVFLVIPVLNLQLIKALAGEEKLYITKHTEVTAVAVKNPYLGLIELGREKAEYEKGSLVIQDAQGNFTEDYKQLTKNFYLKF